jgi:uncharacterized repeat protein (TIGR03803 family)
MPRGLLTFLTDHLKKFLGIWSDTEYRDMPPGTYAGGLNISHFTDSSNSNESIQNCKGNTFSFQPEDIVLQNRVFRVYISSALAGFYQFRFKDANGNTLATTGSIAITPGNLATTYADIIDATPASGGIQDALTTAGQTFAPIGALVATATDEGYFTVELTTVLYWDYQMFAVASSIESPIMIVQEAVDQSLIGGWKDIGSYDLEGELIVWWTTQKNLPELLDISNIANSGGEFEITTSVPHGRANDEKVDILASIVADGQWIITVTGLSTFILPGSTFAAGWVSGGTVTINPNGNGELGRATKNEQTGLWTYFRLIRSQKFNWVTKKQVDTLADKGAIGKRYKWTDDYNKPGIIYDYTLVYQNDVLLTFVDPLNTYAYATLGTEIISQLNTADYSFRFTSQTQTGGNVPSGNSMYATRLLTETLSPTDWSFLDNPIPAAISSEFGSGYSFFGNPPGTPTPKINNFIISGNILGIFKYVELAVANRVGTAVSGYIVRREIITGNTMTLQHTGFEQGTQNLDIGTLNQFTKVIATAKSIDTLAGYDILSNITTTPLIDLSDFFAALTYSIKREQLDPTTAGLGSFIGNSLKVAEYMRSIYVYSKLSYMLNERIRFGFIAEFTDGSIPPAFFSRDIIINTDNTQPGCVAALPNFDLTTGAVGAQHPYLFYIEWVTPNFNQIINGKRVGDFVKKIYCVRCEVENPQVLAGGFIIPAVSGHAGGLIQNQATWVDPSAPATGDQYGEWVFPAGINESTLPNFALNYLYDTSPNPVDFTYEREYASFYAPDIFFGHTQITPIAGDIIKNYGQPTMSRAGYAEAAPPWDYDYYAETNGETNNPPDDVVIDEGVNIGKGGSGTLNGNLFSKKLRVTPGAFTFYFDAPSGMAVYSSTGQFDNLTGNTDIGIYNAQYYRAIASGDIQYGNKVDCRYIWTGTVLEVTDNPPATFDVFGGDTFTQATYFKDRYPTVASPTGMGQGFRIYSQNRINSQMRNGDAGSGTPLTFPDLTAQEWLNNIVIESISYNEGYTPRNGVTSYAAFDPNLRQSNDEPVTVWYSAQFVAGSLQDNNRVYLPNNKKILEYQYGEITSHRTGNGELYTWQPRKFERLNFIANELIRTSSGVEIVLGDGSILKRRPLELSQYGSSNKWGIIKGVAAHGGDTFYWISMFGRCAVRFGYDGTTNQSLIHGKDIFFNNNLNIVDGKDTPADDQGICSVWNQRFKEAIWTVRAWREDIELWVDPYTPNLHDFQTTTGENPTSDLIEAGGLLYGTTVAGGAGGLGVLFSFDPLTSTYTVLHSFIAGVTGNTPRGGVILAADGNLYGTTTSGGVNNVGVIYQWDIAGGIYTKTMDMVAAVGSNPTGKLIEYGGFIFGMTQGGGANGFGAIFRYDYIGNAYLDIHDFDSTNGAQLTGSSFNGLTIVGTELYGMTYRGGAANVGIIFKIDPTVFTFTNLIEFSSVNGASPSHSLVLLNNQLYGQTLAGGANNKGTIFKYDYLLNTIVVLHDYNGGINDGQSPQSSLIASGNILWGTTAFGGVSNLGCVVSYNTTTNIFTLVQSFTGANGQDPRSGLLLYNNTLYGMTRNGGAFGGGVIYAVALTYVTGSVVSIGTLTGYEQIPAFYESLVDGNMSEPPSATWQLVPFTNGIYYNFYTIIFNEIKNHFTTFQTPHPKIYNRYKTTYLSPDPVNEEKIYEHNKGEYEVWYDGQEEEGYITLVFANGNRVYEALMFDPLETPARIDCYTATHESFMLNTDFEDYSGDWGVAIKNNTLDTVEFPNPTNSNEEDTSKLYGNWILIKITFPARVQQKIIGVTLKSVLLARNEEM